MSIAITVDVHDTATRALADLRGGLDQERVNAVIGRSARRIIQDHLRGVDKSRSNKLGGKRTHYFAQAARSANYRSEPDGVAVAISHVGIGLRYFGGEVRPQNAKALTIPAIAEAYGRRAGEFNTLDLVWPKGKSVGALVERARSEVRFRRNKKTGSVKTIKGREVLGGRVFFWLVAKATQAPDPSILPTSDTILFGARSALLDHIRASAR